MVITYAKLFQKLFSGLQVMERTDGLTDGDHSYNPLSAKGIDKL
jgi:hypothetical protein